MIKKIRMRTTAQISRDLGYNPHREQTMVEVNIDLDKLSLTARWLAEHVTATYIVDEYIDRIGIKAVDRFSDKDIDVLRGKPKEYIEQQEYLWGKWYLKKHEIWVSFPIWSSGVPENVFERAAQQLINAKAAELYVVSSPDDRLQIG